MELFTRQAAVALFFGLFTTSTQAKEFSYLETFDDDATFSAGGILPDGWLGDASAVPVQRYEGAYLGLGNYSGSYVLGTMASSSMGRDSWVYTRKLTLKAGVAYTVSYWLHMPGGVAPAVYNNNVALYVGTDQTREAATTLYVQPTAVPETSTFVPDGSYCPVDALDAEYKGLGLNLVAWANVKGSETSVALTSDGSVAFDARLDGDLLTVSGTHAGETVLVSDVAGKTVATAKASAESTALSLSNVPAGLYIVKTDLGARKFVKK